MHEDLSSLGTQCKMNTRVHLGFLFKHFLHTHFDRALKVHFFFYKLKYGFKTLGKTTQK